MQKVNKTELIDFENRVQDLYKNTKIKAPIHLSKGNEDILIDIFKDVQDGDWVFSNWRNHYHALLKGITPENLEKEILEGRSMHIASKENKFFASSLVAGQLSIALGVAMALKLKGSPDHVWAFSGDMAAETGVFHEVTKYALGHDLPITFVIEDDGLSVYTPTKEVWGASTFLNQEQGSLISYTLSQSRIQNGSKERNHPQIKRYVYSRQLSHHGVGLWVEFPEDQKSKSILESYQREIKKAMDNLALDNRVIFLGQTVGYKGSPIYNSLENISGDRRIELPVFEEVQMGMSTGLALEGYIPVSIYPRFDFLTLATNQLVNHLDKISELSHRQFNPQVIVRTMVGSKSPLYPGPQHCQDHTEAYRLMLTNTDVVRITNTEEIVPAYSKSLKNNKSTLLIEKLYE